MFDHFRFIEHLIEHEKLFERSKKNKSENQYHPRSLTSLSFFPLSPKMIRALITTLSLVLATPTVADINMSAITNCHFDVTGDGCNMGFFQTWGEAYNSDSFQINTLGRNTTIAATPCEIKSTNDNQCGKGVCSEKTSTCVCDPYYVHELINFTGIESNNTIIIHPCYYKTTSRTLIFFLSLFLGLCGFDWCWLGVAVNPSFFCLGCFKFFTLGGLGIWWVYDAYVLWAGGGCVDGWGMECWDDLHQTGAPFGVLPNLPNDMLEKLSL